MKFSPFSQRHSSSLPCHSGFSLCHSERSEESSPEGAPNNVTMKQCSHFSRQRGFTLIELLIVITLIGILAVAVLSAINPIEQVNKARDARARGDAAQLLGAIDRYFAANLKFPWTEYDATAGVTGGQLDNDDSFGGAVYEYGVGVCGASGGVTTGLDAWTDGRSSGGCGFDGLLIDTEELKGAFKSRSYFASGVSDANTLWLYKEDSDPSVWICFKPSAKVNQDKALDTNSALKALTFGTSSSGEVSVTGIAQCVGDGDGDGLPGGGTTVPASFSWTGAKDDWCFMCVPE